jgi:predicted phosphate transport protein (TIGR00153 family)
MRFLPREEKFFHYFNQQVSLILTAAQTLRHGLDAGLPALPDTEAKVTDLETQADAVIHEIFLKLGETFITPIDPEDIQSLASHLDDVIDYIEDATHRMNSYRIDQITPTLRDLVKLVEECVMSLQRAFLALEKQESVLVHCIEVNRLEEAADRVVRGAVSALFENEKDPIRLMKYKEVYETLEAATDACEDVADRLQNVVVKNS